MVVEFERRGRVGPITLNCPEARNAVNGAVAEGMEAALDELENDPELWVGVITATAPCSAPARTSRKSPRVTAWLGTSAAASPAS